MPNFDDNRVAKGSFGYSVCTILIFIHVSEGQEKIKRYCLVVECRKFHQVLQKEFERVQFSQRETLIALSICVFDTLLLFL